MDIKKIAIIVTLIMTFSGAVWSGVKWERSLAKQYHIEAVVEKIKFTDARLNQKILSDRIHNIQNRIWQLEGHYGGVDVPMAPSAVKNEYQQLQIDLENAKREMKQIGG